MKVEIEIADGMMNELIRIHDNESLKDLLNSRKELVRLYEPIVQKCIEAYRAKEKLGDQPS